jgi:hypothetical protein
VGIVGASQGGDGGVSLIGKVGPSSVGVTRGELDVGLISASRGLVGGAGDQRLRSGWSRSITSDEQLVMNKGERGDRKVMEGNMSACVRPNF